MSTEQARQDITRRLATVRASIRRAQLLRGGLLLATVALGGLLVIMAADHLFSPLPMAARWVLFGLWLFAIVGALLTGLRPLLRKISLVQIARWLEGRHPEIEERMSTVLEISGGDAGASAGLMEELAKAAGEDVDKVDARAEMKAVGAGKRWARPAAVLAIMLLMLFVLWPKEAFRLVARAVTPFSNLGNAEAVKFTVRPGDVEMLEGDALQIEVSYSGSADQLDLVMVMADGKEIIQPMQHEGELWRYRMNPVRETFRYHARAGRGESDSFSVTVWPSPMMLEPRVRLGFPEYSGLLPQDEPLGRGIEAVRGTTVKLEGKLNTAVESAWVELEGKKIADGKIDAAASGGRVTFAWALDKDSSGEAVVRLKHRLGREVESLRFPVRVLEDQAPVVRWLSPLAKELRVRPDEVLGLRYEVTEDFGLASLKVESKASDKEAVSTNSDLPEKLPGSSRPFRFRGAEELSIGSLAERWPGAGEIRVRVRAEDARPKDLDGPGVGASEWLLLRIDRNAESLARQEMRAEHDGARESIEKALQATREAKDRMDWHRGEMKNEELSKDAKKHFEEARDRLAEAKENLEKLADQMQDSVHASKADEVRKAAERAAAARQELESAPLQDGQQRREEKLDSAREAAEAAMKELEKAREQMDRDRQKIEEVTRLQELAQQQKELARQAENQVAANTGEKPLPQDWQDRQHQMEEQLRQQLREQPQARAEALKDQATEARELAEQAKALSEAQKAMEEQSRQTPANAPLPEQAVQKLREELAQEQAKIAQDTAKETAEARQDLSETADVLPKAEAATREAAEAMAKKEDKAAAEAAKEAVEALKESQKEAAQQAGEAQAPSEQGKNEQGKNEQGKNEQGKNEQGKAEANPAQESQRAAELGELAERQQQVTEALQALAEGKTAEAMQDLREMQADAAADLAHDIAEMPQAEGSGHMNEAKETARQGGEQAKSAAEQAGQGKPQDAAGQHQQSAANLQRSAEALGRAAEEFAQNAAQAQGQQPEQHRANIPPKDLSQAFQSASKATGEKQQGTQSASEAAQAAQALSRAAQSARQSMQGGQPKPGQPGMPGDPQGQPGEKPDENQRTPEADPGVPPELAKLGISASDWEKIQATLKSDVGGGGAGVPEEYRGLVKKYFETMSAK
ncbi:hypothetical protein [Haloferula sp. BvORR071]|uniref:hypothetical protein n=1 Tax=Haloferula sp. BvORR071 TaxID=1396141 RepID=UPI0005585DCC|nr:hypothetical protein [Haloferula sp. BvORR071]